MGGYFFVRAHPAAHNIAFTRLSHMSAVWFKKEHRKEGVLSVRLVRSAYFWTKMCHVRKSFCSFYFTRRQYARITLSITGT